MTIECKAGASIAQRTLQAGNNSKEVQKLLMWDSVLHSLGTS
jgi:hypothetical protein